MDLPRLLFISRRFFPLVGGAEVQMASLAAEMRRRGVEITLLSAQWAPDWPRHITHLEVPIVRLPQPRLRFFGSARYLTSLSRWLYARAGTYDLVYVSMLKHDAYVALLNQRATGIPVVLRAEGAGPTGDFGWEMTANFGRFIGEQCRRADAVVAPSPAVYQELLGAGYPPSTLSYIPNGVPVPSQPTSAEERTRARASLAGARASLALPQDAPLAVFCGRLHPVKGLEVLIRAWAQVVERVPDARLWLVGEGPLHETLTGLARQLNLERHVIIPGPFDSVAEVLRAADIFVLSSHEEGMSMALLEAMAHGLPVVATDIHGNRNLIESDVQGLLVLANDPDALAAGVTTAIEERKRAARWGTAARARVARELSVSAMADRHLELFDRILEVRGR